MKIKVEVVNVFVTKNVLLQLYNHIANHITLIHIHYHICIYFDNFCPEWLMMP